ncbi:outer membrane lipoprotein-sorting protein [Sulfurovum sp. zt1-1]|uniref:Outer membrane lipoprotein-sorting protein n=1 Tax=Sulfurovum zhangzhouensis TaxID=3019067 RepID=A0ABT7QVV7_9BACT|nr:outer membrane lipoprotein-sorting protein [Sulfurovum zhangzhouensis]MDM5270978.1 outer membrane lipoprotein-sorting protein [Sulfurovum zhangzhouensis]
MKKMILFLSFIASFLIADEAQTIISKLEDNLRGKDIYAKMQIIVKTKRHTRTMMIESWGKGKKKNFTKILAPSRDMGITFLNLDKQMWQYVPKIERIIKIPASMMLQSWMGTDITNDDMVKQSSLVDDYQVSILKKEGPIVTLKLIPKKEAAVVWGKIISRVDTRYYVEVEDHFYDDDGVEVRVMKYSDIKKFGTHYVTTTMRIIPLDPDKQGNETMIKMLDVTFDQGISEAYFSKSALKRFSR